MPNIELYDRIDEYTTQSIISQLSKASQDNVVLRIHSIGGSVFDGNLLFNKIKEHGKVTGIVEGICASMASIVLQACSVRKMADNSMLMIHAPKTLFAGNSQMAEKDIKILKSIEDQFKKILVSRCQMNEEKVSTLMNGLDHWYTAEEAKEEGLIDEIVDSTTADMDKEILHAMMGSMKKYVAIINNKPDTQKNIKDMINDQLKKQVLAMGVNPLDFTDTDSVVSALVGKVEAYKQQAERVSVLENELKESKKVALAQAVEDLIKQGFADKKLTKEFADKLQKQITEGQVSLEAAKEIVASLPAFESITDKIGKAGEKDSKILAELQDKSFAKLLQEGKAEQLKKLDIELFKKKYKEQYNKEYTQN